MKKISLIIILVLTAGLSRAETVTLNNGRIIEGTIVGKTDDEVRIDTGAGTVVTYFMDEVKSVGGAEAPAQRAAEVTTPADKSVPASPVVMRVFGGKGGSPEDALIVPDVANYLKCTTDIECISKEYGQSIGQEYQYLDKTYGIQGRDWDLKGQELLQEGEKSYDKITIFNKKANEEAVIYFDITQPMKNFSEMLQRARQ